MLGWGPHLTGKSLRELKQLAKQCGLFASGNKQAIVSQLGQRTAERIVHRDAPVHVVSIDVGAKNLGVSHISELPLGAADMRADARQIVVNKCYTESISVPPRYPRFADEVRESMLKCLNFKPDAVLIERQRLRTNSAPAVANNVLYSLIIEGMLFTALGGVSPTINAESVDPSRVVRYWGLNRSPKQCRRDLVAEWVASGKISFPKYEIAQRARKNDDMFDSLVQGVTWLEWRRNAHMLAQDMNLINKK